MTEDEARFLGFQATLKQAGFTNLVARARQGVDRAAQGVGQKYIDTAGNFFTRRGQGKAWDMMVQNEARRRGSHEAVAKATGYRLGGAALGGAALLGGGAYAATRPSTETKQAGVMEAITPMARAVGSRAIGFGTRAAKAVGQGKNWGNLMRSGAEAAGGGKNLARNVGLGVGAAGLGAAGLGTAAGAGYLAGRG